MNNIDTISRTNLMYNLHKRTHRQMVFEQFILIENFQSTNKRQNKHQYQGYTFRPNFLEIFKPYFNHFFDFVFETTDQQFCQHKPMHLTKNLSILFCFFLVEFLCRKLY